MRKGFIVTRGFENTLIGSLELDTEFDDLTLAQCVLAPAYKQNDDGTIELLEFSLIPAPDAQALIKRGMDKANETN